MDQTILNVQFSCLHLEFSWRLSVISYHKPQVHLSRRAFNLCEFPAAQRQCCNFLLNPFNSALIFFISVCFLYLNFLVHFMQERISVTVQRPASKVSNSICIMYIYFQ